jgi:hypothetical protein
LAVLANAEEEHVHAIGGAAALFGAHLDVEKAVARVEIDDLRGQAAETSVELLVDFERAIEVLGVEAQETAVTRDELRSRIDPDV